MQVATLKRLRALGNLVIHELFIYHLLFIEYTTNDNDLIC